MSIQRLQDHWGFTRMPFGRSLAPSMLHRHDGHAEAVARIGWCIDQHALGVITGEVGAGKTVAVRAATAALDTSRHVVIYLPNPSVGVRGMLHHIVATLGQHPQLLHRDPGAAGRRGVGRRARRTRPNPDRGLRRGAPARQRATGSRPHAHQPRHGLRRTVRGLLWVSPRCGTGCASACSPPSTSAITVRYALAGMTATETARLHHPPRQDRRPERHPVQRRRRHPDPQRLPRLPAGDQQPRRQRAHLRVRAQDLDRRRESRPHRDLRNRRRLTGTITTPSNPAPSRPRPRPRPAGGAFPHHDHRQHERRHRLQDQRRSTSAFASWVILRPLGNWSLPHGRPTGAPSSMRRTPTGLSCCAWSRRDRAGRLLNPGDGGALPTGDYPSGRHPPLRCGQSLRPRWNIPSAGVTFTRRHQRFTHVRPSPTDGRQPPPGREAPASRRSSPRPPPPDGTAAASASTPGFAPRGYPRRTPRRRRAIAHWPGYYAATSAALHGASHFTHAPSRRT